MLLFIARYLKAVVVKSNRDNVFAVILGLLFSNILEKVQIIEWIFALTMTQS